VEKSHPQVGLGKRRNRQRQLDMAMAIIQRQHGPWALVKGGVRIAAATIPHIPTGFPALDRALTIGGLPRGQVCELAGPATSGKTTLALKFLAQAQASGTAEGRVAYVDQALYFDPDYAYRCDVDLSRLLVGTAHDLREALATTEALARSGGLAALVFDALDFLWTDPVAASLLAATLNRLPAALARSGTALLVLHESPGGRSSALSALDHTAAVCLQVMRERWLRQGDDVRGYEARVEVRKNRFGPAGRSAQVAIKFNGTVRGNGL
jgi:recombination protein RecA